MASKADDVQLPQYSASKNSTEDAKVLDTTVTENISETDAEKGKVNRARGPDVTGFAVVEQGESFVFDGDWESEAH